MYAASLTSIGFDSNLISFRAFLFVNFAAALSILAEEKLMVKTVRSLIVETLLSTTLVRFAQAGQCAAKEYGKMLTLPQFEFFDYRR